MSPAAGLVLAVLAVSTAAVLIKACAVPSLGVAAWRLTLASLFFLALCAVRRHPVLQGFERRDLHLAVLAGLFLGAHFGTWIASLEYTSVTSSVVLVCTVPLWVGLGSAFILREPPSRWLWQGLALALAGAVLVATADQTPAGDAPDPLLGDLLALAGALGSSAYFLVGRRLHRVDTLSYVTVVYSTAAVSLVLAALVARVPLAGYAWRDWGLLALLALVPQGVGHTLLNRSLRYFPAGVVAVALLGEPVGASVLAWLALGEQPGALQIAGALLILGGVAWASRTEAS